MTNQDALSTLTCPLCLTVAPAMTAESLAGGGEWRCPQCHQNWSAKRLATVAAYTEYCASLPGATAAR